MDAFLIIGWFVLSLIVGMIGESRNIGFGGGFIISLLLSPLIGIIVVLASRGKLETQVLLKQRDQSQVSELEKLASLKDGGHLSQEEYDKLKARILPATVKTLSPEQIAASKKEGNGFAILIVVILVIVVIVAVAIKNQP